MVARFDCGQGALGKGMDVVPSGGDFGAFYSGREAVERRGGGGRHWWTFMALVSTWEEGSRWGIVGFLKGSGRGR
jgi:hypothetical protein